jgi:plastocyanin
MRALYLLPLILAAPAATVAQPMNTVDVRLTNFAFTPKTIHLRAGQPVMLRLINPGSHSHDFSAPEFFAAATMASGNHAMMHHAGAFEVPGHQTVTVELTPRRGNYRLRCTHTFHSLLGMRGRIIVE